MNQEQFYKKSKEIKRDNSYEDKFINILTEAWEWLALAECDPKDKCVLAICLDYSYQIHTLSKRYELCNLINEVDEDVELHDKFGKIYQLVVNKFTRNKDILKKGFGHFRDIQRIVNRKGEFEPQLEIGGKTVNIIEYLDGGLFRYICLMNDVLTKSELEVIVFLSKNTCSLCDALKYDNFQRVHLELARLNSFIHDC